MTDSTRTRVHGAVADKATRASLGSLFDATMRLALELMFVIADHCVLNELEANEALLRPHDSGTSVALSLLLTSRALHTHVATSAGLRRLRLWRVLLRIPHQFEPVPLVLDTSHLHADLQTERIDALGTTETFLVLTQRRAPRQTRLRFAHPHQSDPTPLDYPSAKAFLDDVCAFAMRNGISIWLWTCASPPVLREAALAQPGFRTLVDLPHKKWIAWDRPTPDQRRFTEDVLRNNVESFGKLAP